MKFLSEILYKSRILYVSGSTNVAIEHITSDSRDIQAFCCFVALKGTIVDGHKYIDQAVAKGAKAIICEYLPSELNEKVTYIQVQNTAESLGFIASNFYDNPSEKMKVIGITGTNGKTTTVTLLHSLFRRMNKKAGMLSTIVNKIIDKEIPATHTTPDPINLNRTLNEMVQAGCTHVFMEVSSHAIVQNRVTGLEFSGMVFTNISHDHLDYHGTFKEYIKAKKKAFDQLNKKAFALINIDDPNGEIMVQNFDGTIVRMGVKYMADYKAKVIENQFSGLHLYIDNQEIFTKLIGQFNAYNLLTVYAVARQLGLDKLDVLTVISSLESVEGRFQYLKTANNITAIVDYAHTPDALENVLKTIADIRNRSEKVITVVGCGGDRDREKRPEMAKIAATFSEQVILTSDNPRSEDPDVIISEMRAGIDPSQASKTMEISNRKEAIKTACNLAQDGDIILIAGKGHEKYQEIKGEKFPFDDFQIVDETLKILQK